MYKGIVLAIIIGALTGCASSSVNYTPPIKSSVTNQIIVNESFDVVWDRLVKKLSSDFFVINNIEKNSRIINVSFSSSHPSEYVDCGLSTRKFKNMRGEKKYSYNPADSARYSITNGGTAFNANRISRLNGRTNIYVAPDSEGTVVSVNTKYILDLEVKYINFNNQPGGSDSWTIDLSTKTPFITPDPTEGVTCIAKGNIESKILNYAK